MSKQVVNLLPFLCEAFSLNRKIYKDIDRIYHKDMTKYFNAADKHSLAKHKMAHEGSLEQEEYFKKALGLLLYEEETGEELLKIIEKGWNYTYTYVQNHKVSNMTDFVKALFRKRFSGVDFHTHLVIYVSLATKYCSFDNNDKSFLEFLSFIDEKWNFYNKEQQRVISYNKATIKERKLVLNIREELINNLGNIKRFENLTNDYQNTFLHEHACKLSFYFDLYDFSSYVFNEFELTTKELDQLIYVFLKIFINEKSLDEISEESVRNMSPEDFSKLLTGLYFCFFFKSYNKAKEYHFRNNKEILFLRKKEEEQKNVEVNNEILKYKQENADLLKRISELEKKNKKLTLEIKNNKIMETEVTFLREFMFSCDKESYIENNNEVNVEKLKTIKGLIVGGHEDWQHKLKEKLPNFKFLHPSMINFDKSLLEHIDVVFFYTDYLNHSMYYKVINNIKNVKIKYLSYNTNIDITLNEIMKKFK